MRTSTFSTINSVKADAHAFRVTLTLIRKSTNCPIEVADIVDRLSANGWKRKTLAKIELEILYSNLDNDLCAEALGEWDIESHRMRDWGYPFWRPDYKEWWDGENRKVDCRLCGHRDNRYEFPLVNTKNNEEIWTGSTCIVKYGVTVDGEACAEEALAKLRGIMGQSKKAQTRHEWREQHSDSDAVMATIEKVLPICNTKYIPWKIKRASDDDGNRLIPWNFDSQRRLLGKWARGAIKYYKKNGYLTPQRTSEVYSAMGDAWVPNGQMSRMARELHAIYLKAEEFSGDKKIREFWDNFILDHPQMNEYQKSRVAYWRSNFYPISSLYPQSLRLIEEIKTQHAKAAEKGKKGKSKDAAKKKKKSAEAKCPWL